MPKASLGKSKAVEGKTSAAVSEKRMEEELTVVWNYYLDARGKQENFTPSKKRMGRAILRGLHEGGSGTPVIDMVIAIDLATHLAKKNPKKAFLTAWFAMFSKWSTFRSLVDQHQDNESVPEAAELPFEYEAASTPRENV